MEKEKLNKWLEATVSDIFMDFCFYDRKEDEEMGVDQMRKLMDNGELSKQMMIDAFTAQINNEYVDES